MVFDIVGFEVCIFVLFVHNRHNMISYLAGDILNVGATLYRVNPIDKANLMKLLK